MKKIILIALIQMLTMQTIAQVTTYFYGKNRIESKNWTAALYSVEIFENATFVTIELIPKRNLKRMTYWTSRNTYIVVKDWYVELPIEGFATELGDGLMGIRTEPFSGNWGWNNVKKGEKYYYTLQFEGGIPPGVTNFTMIDRGNSLGEHGYQFKNYELNNPPIGATSFTEDFVKNNSINNNDGICGIYESTEEEGYKLGCIKENGVYKLIYLDGDINYDWWKIGDIKATLQPSATNGVYKAIWYMAMKNKNEAIITFDEISMNISIDNRITSYIKMFPTTNSTTQFKEWTGTGFALNHRYIVTNFHVIDGAKTIKVYGIDGIFNNEYNVNIFAIDKTNDLAILEVSNEEFKGFDKIPYNIKTTLAEVGEETFVLGYPLTNTMGEEIKLTTGVISSKSGFKGDISTYQISTPIQPGNSGAPLFDRKGNLIGIVNAKHNEAENVGYAIKASYLKNIAEIYSLPISSPNHKQKNTSLTELVKLYKNYVYMIKCYK